MSSNAASTAMIPSGSPICFYNPQEDFYVCPMGQRLRFIRQEKRHTASGYQQTVSIYRATRCEGCPLRGQCHKSKGDRQIEVNHTLDDYKARARELLTGEQGLKTQKQPPGRAGSRVRANQGMRQVQKTEAERSDRSENRVRS